MKSTAHNYLKINPSSDFYPIADIIKRKYTSNAKLTKDTIISKHRMKVLLEGESSPTFPETFSILSAIDITPAQKATFIQYLTEKHEVNTKQLGDAMLSDRVVADEKEIAELRMHSRKWTAYHKIMSPEPKSKERIFMDNGSVAEEVLKVLLRNEYLIKDENNQYIRNPELKERRLPTEAVIPSMRNALDHYNPKRMGTGKNGAFSFVYYLNNRGVSKIHSLLFTFLNEIENVRRNEEYQGVMPYTVSGFLEKID